MKGMRKTAFIVCVILQVLFLVGMIAKRLHLLRTGAVVRLQCRPVDPRSLLSGDYVILNYDISSFGRRRWQRLKAKGEEFRRNETVYVGLEKKAGASFFTATAVSHHYEKVAAVGRVVIRGRLTSSYAGRLRYGVEHFFVPQFEGKRIERNLAKTSVDVAVSSSGESAIKRLFIDGKEVVFR